MNRGRRLWALAVRAQGQTRLVSRRLLLGGTVWLAVTSAMAAETAAVSITPVDAQTNTVGAAVTPDRAALRDRLAALNPFRAHFAQYVEGARGQVLEESTGELAMQRPNFRWQVDAPYPQIIVADGEQLSIYDPDLEQVILRDLKAALADTPIALLTQSDLVLSEQFEVLLLPPAGDGEPEVFLLSPRDPDSLFQEVQLHFINATLQQLLIYDHLGQSTTVRFRPISVDGPLPATLFQLELPDDVDVIEG